MFVEILDHHDRRIDHDAHRDRDPSQAHDVGVHAHQAHEALHAFAVDDMAVVGEFIASEEGLGYLMLQVQVTMDTAAMFMAVLLITLVGVSLYGLGLLLERLFVAGDARVD